MLSPINVYLTQFLAREISFMFFLFAEDVIYFYSVIIIFIICIIYFSLFEKKFPFLIQRITYNCSFCYNSLEN